MERSDSIITKVRQHMIRSTKTCMWRSSVKHCIKNIQYKGSYFTKNSFKQLKLGYHLVGQLTASMYVNNLYIFTFSKLQTFVYIVLDDSFILLIRLCFIHGIIDKPHLWIESPLKRNTNPISVNYHIRKLLTYNLFTAFQSWYKYNIKL